MAYTGRVTARQQQHATRLAERRAADRQAAREAVWQYLLGVVREAARRLPRDPELAAVTMAAATAAPDDFDASVLATWLAMGVASRPTIRISPGPIALADALGMSSRQSWNWQVRGHIAGCRRTGGVHSRTRIPPPALARFLDGWVGRRALRKALLAGRL